MGHADRHEGPDGRADPAGGGGAERRSCADVSERLEALERCYPLRPGAHALERKT